MSSQSKSLVIAARQMLPWHRLVVLAGAWARFVLPLLIVLGRLGRLAALGRIGFVLVRRRIGGRDHDVLAGAWQDRAWDVLILDQRAFWLFRLVLLVVNGSDPLSADRIPGVERARLAA